VVLAIGADVATVWTATYDSVVSGWVPATVESVGGVASSAASESLPAHTPAAITAASSAPAAPTGAQRSKWFGARRLAELRELEERELDDFEPDEPDDRPA
ncbi:MAG TPA: hypothetical protein VF065_15810, partial [Ilumatobacter sp.]